MHKRWLLIIVPAAIWVLHTWISEDDPSDSAQELACEPESPGQEVARGLLAGDAGYTGSAVTAQSREPRIPPVQPGYAPHAGQPPEVIPRYSGELTDPMALQGYRFRPSTRETTPRTPVATPAYPGRQFGRVEAPAYSGQQSGGRSAPAYSAPQFGSVYPPAYTGQQQAPPTPAYPEASEFPRYGAGDPVGAAPPVQMRFRPLEKSNRSPRRWTGNYAPPHQRTPPESYGQRGVPRDHGSFTPRTWTPPPRNNLLLQNGLGAQDVYSAR